MMPPQGLFWRVVLKLCSALIATSSSTSTLIWCYTYTLTLNLLESYHREISTATAAMLVEPLPGGNSEEEDAVMDKHYVYLKKLKHDQAAGRKLLETAQTAQAAHLQGAKSSYRSGKMAISYIVCFCKSLRRNIVFVLSSDTDAEADEEAELRDLSHREAALQYDKKVVIGLCPTIESAEVH